MVGPANAAQNAERERLARALQRYKYLSPKLSLLEELALDALWRRIVEYVPCWLAPNVITLLGGASVAIALLLTLCFSPALEGTAPAWVYCINALLVLAYQTFDGCDGKQARRTGSGSALGELMDHGVDAWAVGAVVFVCMDAFGFGVLSPWPWVTLVGAQASFHASNLTLLLSGRMHVNRLDVLELQWASMAMLLTTALAGPGVWSARLPFEVPVYDASAQIDWRHGVPLRDPIMLCSLLGMLRNLRDWGGSLAAAVRAKPAGAEQNAGARLLFRQAALLAGFAATVGVCVRECAAQPDAKPQLVLLLLASCHCFGEAMARLLVQRVAEVEMPLVPPGLLCLLSNSAAAGKGVGACAGVLALAATLHVSYFVRMACAIADALGISVLRILPPPPGKAA